MRAGLWTTMVKLNNNSQEFLSAGIDENIYMNENRIMQAFQMFDKVM